jgi:hypothetical protein
MFALLLALAPAADDAPFVAVGADGERVAGRLVRLSTDFSATLTTRTGNVAVKDVISLRRENRPLPPFPTGPQLVTAAGDRVAGTVLGGSKDSLRFAPSALTLKKEQAWVVPLSALSVVWLTDTPADTPPDPARYTWTEGNKNRDVLRFRNGDTPTGILVGIAADEPTFRFRPDGGEAREIPGKEVAAVAFNPVLVRARKPKGPFARLVLADGSRLALTNASVSGGLVKGDTLFGQKVELPLDVVVALDVLQGKAVYLSDLKPKKVEQAGFLGAGWPWAADRTVNGDPLRVAGPGGESTFDKGLGTHPRTVLTYDLRGKYRRFEALVGLDPETGDRGRAVVRVRVDGKEQVVPGLGSLAAGKPVAVKVDVSGAKELVLEVDFGPAGGVRSVVNWADARLVE